MQTFLDKNHLPSISVLSMIRPLLLLVITVISQAVFASGLQPYTLEYESYYRNFSVNTQRTLEKKDNSYTITMRSENFLLSNTEISRFKLSGKNTIIPQSYDYERNVLGKSTRRKTVFDSDNHQVRYASGKKSESLPWKEGFPVLDVLNYQEQIRLDLINGKSLSPDRDYFVFDKGRTHSYQFHVVGEEKVKTPMGDVDCIKIERVRKDPDTHTYIWLAKSWAFIIVKILHQEAGKADSVLTLAGGSFNGKPLSRVDG